MLGGAINGTSANNEAVLNEAAERLIAVPALARRYPNARILLSGSSGSLFNESGTEIQ